MLKLIVDHQTLLLAFVAGAVVEYGVSKTLVSPVAKVKAVATAIVAAFKATPPAA